MSRNIRRLRKYLANISIIQYCLGTRIGQLQLDRIASVVDSFASKQSTSTPLSSIYAQCQNINYKYGTVQSKPNPVFFHSPSIIPTQKDTRLSLNCTIYSARNEELSIAMLSTDLHKNHVADPRLFCLLFARSRFSHKGSKEEKIETMVGAAAALPLLLRCCCCWKASG